MMISSETQTFSFMSSCSSSMSGCSATMERRDCGKLGMRFCRHSSDCTSTGICSTAFTNQRQQLHNVSYQQLPSSEVLWHHYIWLRISIKADRPLTRNTLNASWLLTDNSNGLVMVIRNYHWLNSASRVLISTCSAPLVQTAEHKQISLFDLDL